MAAPGSTNALRSGTFDNLVLNAGILIKNLVFTGQNAPANATELKTLIAGIVAGTTTGKGTVFGATRGGGSFTVTRDMRTPEIDGMRYNFKGGNFVDSVDAYISTTFVEITEGNVADLLGATKDTTSSTTYVQRYKMQTAIPSSAYLDNVCWVGDLADKRNVMICLYNAINTADFNLTYTDKGEATAAVEFHATQAAVNDYDYAPFEVVFFDKAA